MCRQLSCHTIFIDLSIVNEQCCFGNLFTDAKGGGIT